MDDRNGTHVRSSISLKAVTSRPPPPFAPSLTSIHLPSSDSSGRTWSTSGPNPIPRAKIWRSSMKMEAHRKQRLGVRQGDARRAGRNYKRFERPLKWRWRTIRACRRRRRMGWSERDPMTGRRLEGMGTREEGYYRGTSLLRICRGDCCGKRRSSMRMMMYVLKYGSYRRWLNLLFPR
jgi:hypothetical protein